MRYLAIVLCLLAGTALSQTATTTAGATAAVLADMTPQNTLATVTADLNNDGVADRAVLFRAGKEMDGALAIFDRGDPDRLALFAPAIAWVGGLGQQPDLGVSPRGSLLVKSMNDSVGRERWFQTVTIAYRKGRYLLAGITYDWYDTLDPANTGTCDLNLLTGKGTLQKGETGPATALRVSLRAMPPEDWDGALPPECFP